MKPKSHPRLLLNTFYISVRILFFIAPGLSLGAVIVDPEAIEEQFIEAEAGSLAEDHLILGDEIQRKTLGSKKVEGGKPKIRVIALLDFDRQILSRKEFESDPIRLQDRLKVLAQRRLSLVEAELAKSSPDFSKHLIFQNLLWINSAVSVDVDEVGLNYLRQVTGIRKIYSNRRMASTPQYDLKESFSKNWGWEKGRVPENLKLIRLDRLVSEYPKVNGDGVVVGMIDTGIDATHPALRGKLRAFFNAEEGRVTDKVSEAFDFESHGTQVAGIVVGGDRKNHLMGVAPASSLVVSAGLDWELELRGMQFMLNPDGNPKTKFDIPRVVNNSWASIDAPDQEVFYRAIEAWVASGIIPVFSAGNSGPGLGTITPPKEHPYNIVVGGVTSQGKIVERSSRGPGLFRGQKTKKPDLVSPSEKIYSSLPGERFGESSGTSFAAPHVSAVIALMLQVNPRLQLRDIKKILFRTARQVPRAPSGWNPHSGYGVIDAYRAVTTVMKQSLGIFEGPPMAEELQLEVPFN